MADIAKPQSIRCRFMISWVGQCNKETDNGWCDKHERLKCVSCHAKAVTDCDATMGGLTCGVPLCAACTHTRGGDHITKEKADEIRAAERREQQVMIASRTSPVQRKNDSEVPCNLFELSKDPQGYMLQHVFYLEISHDLMGFFPAIVKETKEIIVTTDKALLIEVWKRLEPRLSKLQQLTGFVGNGVVYCPDKTDKGYEEMEKINPHPLVYKGNFRLSYRGYYRKSVRMGTRFDWC